MKFFSLLLLCGFLCSGLLVSAAPVQNGDDHEPPSVPVNFSKLEHKYKRYMKETLDKRGSNHTCNSKTVQIRREWGSMSPQDRIDYTNAVKCLIATAPKSLPTDVPGARTRLDDFAAAHIQQSNYIHFNGNLFAWHRYFVWTYEQVLRNECGYKGAQPYWDWSLFADDPRLSPVFDGSATSMGGNGDVIVHGATLLSAFGLQFTLPPGTGGGCVSSGPFANLSVNIGYKPTVLATAQSAINGNGTVAEFGIVLGSNITSALVYDPRCLTRDINLFWSNQTHLSDIEYLLSCPNVTCLEKRADGWEFPSTVKQPLIHAAGHFAIGGLQNDPFASPGDPVFYLHHAQLDRMWSIWQGQDAAKRLYQVGGTKTPFNVPPSDPVTLDDELSFGAVTGAITHRDAQSTIDGELCYMYD